jgi:hypothetical protein
MMKKNKKRKTEDCESMWEVNLGLVKVDTQMDQTYHYSWLIMSPSWVMNQKNNYPKFKLPW